MVVVVVEELGWNVKEGMRLVEEDVMLVLTLLDDLGALVLGAVPVYSSTCVLSPTSRVILGILMQFHSDLLLRGKSDWLERIWTASEIWRLIAVWWACSSSTLTCY